MRSAALLQQQRPLPRTWGTARPCYSGRVRRCVRVVAEQQQQQMPDGIPPSPYASRPAPPSADKPPLQQPAQPQQHSAPPALRGSGGGGGGSGALSGIGPPSTSWVPISGPPSDDPPEMRRMQHPADAEDAAPTSIVEVATQQQLAIGKREAREQAVALATAHAEIVRWRAVAEDAVAAKQLLVERNRELELQRNESMSVNRELLAGYKHMVSELEVTNQQLARHEENATQFRQQLLDMRSWVDGDTGPGAPVPQPPSSGAAGGAGGADVAGVTMGQLVQLSGQLARDAERDDQRRQQLQSDLVPPQGGRPAAAGPLAGAAAPPAPNGSGNGSNKDGNGVRGSSAAPAAGAAFTPAVGGSGSTGAGGASEAA